MCAYTLFIPPHTKIVIITEKKRIILLISHTSVCQLFIIGGGGEAVIFVLPNRTNSLAQVNDYNSSVISMKLLTTLSVRLSLYL